MEKVDLLLLGGTAATMDAEYRVISPGAVAVRGPDIVAVGPAKELEMSYEAKETIRCDDEVIIPGLINAHTHLPMSLVRGLADDLRLDVWLYGYILPVEKTFANPEFCYLGTLLSCAELIRSGVTCFADMYYFEQEVAWAAAEAGMRGICGETLMNMPTPDATSYDESLAYCREFLEQFRDHERIIAAPAPHAVYTCTPELLRESTRLAQEHDVPILIHISETKNEVDEWVKAHKMPPIRWLEAEGFLDGKVLAAHCVWVNTEEIRILSDRRVGVAHNPTSNMKLASGFAPTVEMLASGVSLGIGTDGCASNNDLDMFEEIRLAALLPKGYTYNPTAISSRDALSMATIGGARALHLDELIGSIEVGKRADLAVIQMDRVHAVPHFDTTGENIYSQIVYAAKSTDVRHVIIHGQVVMRDRQLLSIDEENVIEQARDLSRRINRFFVERESSLLDKLVAIGELEQSETFEVQVKGEGVDEEMILKGLQHPSIRITKQTVRDQYDTYLLFDDPKKGHIRYREDALILEDGSVSPMYTLTLTEPAREAEYENSIVLTRSRYTTPATRSLRFYREYFQPSGVREIIKHRRRYRIRYKGMDFAVNLDEITHPRKAGLFAEIKSRTWSKRDALHKAKLIGELLRIFRIEPEQLVLQEYVDIFAEE